MQQLEMFAAGSGAFDNLESFESEQKRDALNTQPSWLGVCVYLLKRSKTCTRLCLVSR